MTLDETVSGNVRLLAEESHSLVAERLSAIENEVEDLFNRVPFGSYTESADGTLLSFNALALAWMGRTSQELIGKRKFIDILSPISQGIYQQSTVENGRGELIINLHLDMIRADGSVMPIALSKMNMQTSATKALKIRYMILELR